MTSRGRTAVNLTFCTALLGGLLLMWRGLEALVLGAGAGRHGLAYLAASFTVLMTLAAVGGVRSSPAAREPS